MGTFFAIIFFASAVSILVLLAISVYMFFFQKDNYKKWLVRAGIAVGVLIVSVIGGVSTSSTPEQRAEMEQKRIAEQAQKEQEKAEKEARKAQEVAQTNAQKEQKAADAAAQKAYDDQVKYEEWVRTHGIIGKSPGIGDRVEEFAKKHKISSDAGMVKSYDDSHFNAVIVDGRIENLTINAAAGHKMDSLVSELTPSDGTEVSSSVDNSDPLLSKHISIGRSDMLGIAFPRSNGFYTRIDTYDSRSGDYLHTTLAIGQKE
jgi:hypothetical protein